jgi:predicted RNA-binding protein with PUA-like domain
MIMAEKFWLMKSEPGEYSIQDLKKAPDGVDCWDGVRNYQARNMLRDEIRVGDRVLFYHSGKHPSVVGTARVVKAGYPDITAFDTGSKHFDPKSDPKRPTWFMVDIQFESEFPKPVPLKLLRQTPGLENMMLLRKGMRLSIQPVTPQEARIIQQLSRKYPKNGSDNLSS